MIPFFQWTAIALGPVTIHVWGLMVSLGILVGLLVALRVAKRRGLNAEKMMDVAFWAIFSALIGSRLLYVLVELPEYIDAPLNVFKVWEGGLSFSGGLLGAAIAAWVYFRRHDLPWRAYVESGVMGLPIGIAIGRLGCFFIFDHPGIPTSFFLGEEYIDRIVRHNHGLYLSIEQLALSIVFFVLWKSNPQRRIGVYTALFLLWHGVARFLLDFWRAIDLPNSDPRFFGLTVAQYLSIVAVVGAGILWYSLSHGLRTKTQTSKESVAD